ncbi:MAG: hypothetical protein PF961_17750 [Planctomycetota bacterium]|jgi:hypothetical protein|nr:hypothetical protein [Planctomycetota bacterium]
MSRLRLLCLLVLVTSGALQAATFHPPETMIGSEVGAAAGHNVTESGAGWAICQVWPDNPVQADTYVPMIWQGKGWTAAEHGFGGQPSATVKAGVVSLGVRGGWTGHEEKRIAALVFTAPSDGRYAVTGECSLKRWHGTGAVQLLVVHVNSAKARAVQLAKVTVDDSADEPVVVAVSAVRLSKGDKIALAGYVPSMHTAADLHIKDLSITEK